MDWQYESLQRDINRLQESHNKLELRLMHCEDFPSRLYMRVGLALIWGIAIASIVLAATGHHHR